MRPTRTTARSIRRLSFAAAAAFLPAAVFTPVAARAESVPDLSKVSVPNAWQLVDEYAGKCADLDRIATSPRTGSPWMGAKDPIVVVNIFSDFQCPVCRRSADPIKAIATDFADSVRVVFRHNALKMHGRARPTAIAAAAAQRQGKFWQYHDLVFGARGALDDATLRGHAETLGLDLRKFDRDLADPEIAQRVDLETDWAPRLGAAGTPSLFVNGERQVGWGSYMGLRWSVEMELIEAKKLLESGVPRSRVAAERIRAGALKNVADPGDPEGEKDTDLWVEILTSP